MIAASSLWSRACDFENFALTAQSWEDWEIYRARAELAKAYWRRARGRAGFS